MCADLDLRFFFLIQPIRIQNSFIIINIFSHKFLS